MKSLKLSKLFNKTYSSREIFHLEKKQTWNLEPYWTKVEISNPVRHQHNLIVKSKDKVVLLGSFLNYNDKRKLLTQIESALQLLNNKMSKI